MTLPGRYAQIAFEVFDLRVEVRAELVVTDLPAIYRESHDRAKDTNKTPQDSGLHPRPTSTRKEYGEDTRSGYERDQTEQLQTNVISESDIRTHLSVAALNGEKLCRLITLFGKRHVEIMRPTSQMCQSGLGRCGTTFACEREDVIPDIYMLGKALGGGIVPVSAVVSRNDVLGGWSLRAATGRPSAAIRWRSRLVMQW
jgi:hypothetical protein